jgi:hypothetical protein
MRCLCGMQAPTVQTVIDEYLSLVYKELPNNIKKKRYLDAKNVTNYALLYYKFLCISYEHVVIKFETHTVP